jgi:EAL domain-containing protein (putative c-di-GMP-specific phosphodiesterase class I)
VAGLGLRLEDAALVRAIIQLAQSLAVGTVAEGIEPPDQLAELAAMGCDLGQGYYFSAPDEPAAIAGLLHLGLETPGAQPSNRWSRPAEGPTRPS